MKKTYLSIASAIVLTLGMNAQTLFNSGFDEASYDVADVQTDLANHPDWAAGHFGNPSTWRANANNQIITGSAFAYNVLNTTAITGTTGDVITITALVPLGFGGATPNIYDNVNGDRTMFILGLSPSANPTAGSDLNPPNRDGGAIRTLAASEEVQLSAVAGTASGALPSVPQAINNPYEVVIEYTIGADAASSSKRLRITNTTTNATSTTVTATGMSSAVYDAITGTGAFYFTWTQAFLQAAATRPMQAINSIVLNRLTIEKNNAVLSVSDFNKSDISSSIYPNPVSSELTIEGIDTETYKVVDLSGATVLETAATGTLNVSALATGIYFLVTDAGTTKFVKQ